MLRKCFSNYLPEGLNITDRATERTRVSTSPQPCQHRPKRLISLFDSRADVLCAVFSVVSPHMWTVILQMLYYNSRKSGMSVISWSYAQMVWLDHCYWMKKEDKHFCLQVFRLFSRCSRQLIVTFWQYFSSNRFLMQIREERWFILIKLSGNGIILMSFTIWRKVF